MTLRNYAIRAVMSAFSPHSLCVTVSHTILPACQLLKYIVAIMKLFAYNDNTHKISHPEGALAQLLPINLEHFHVECCPQSVSKGLSGNNLVPAVLILN